MFFRNFASRIVPKNLLQYVHDIFLLILSPALECNPFQPELLRKLHLQNAHSPADFLYHKNHSTIATNGDLALLLLGNTSSGQDIPLKRTWLYQALFHSPVTFMFFNHPASKCYYDYQNWANVQRGQNP
jgi:hypothetical protein